MDLYVQEPGGEVIYYGNRTSDTGGQLDFDSNAGCSTNIDNTPVENVCWPSGTPTGTYTYWADHFSLCGDTTPEEVTLEVRRNGAVVATQTAQVPQGGESTRFTFVF